MAARCPRIKLGGGKKKKKKKEIVHRGNLERRTRPQCVNATMPTKNVIDERISKFKNKGKDPAVS